MQSKLESAIESVINILIGYSISIMAQLIIFPVFDMQLSFADNLQIGAFFTVVSLIRSYFIRRFFNKLLINRMFKNEP